VKNVKHEILIIGRGGQGVLLLGRILGTALTKYGGYYVSLTESYGAETRGTESRSDIIISDRQDEVDYVKVRKATVFLVLYPLNIENYLKYISEDTVLMLNSTYINDIPGVKVREKYTAPYSEIAERETGTVRTTNMVALGHLVKVTKLTDPVHVEKTIMEMFTEKWIDINIKAFRAGLNID